MGDLITVRHIRDAINRQRFHYANEVELHGGLAQVLAGLGLTVEREVRLGGPDRIDITVELARPDSRVRVGIEAKIAGQPGSVRRQLSRYARYSQLDALMLVTSVRRHTAEMVAYAEVATAGGPGADAGTRWVLDGTAFDMVLLDGGLL